MTDNQFLSIFRKSLLMNIRIIISSCLFLLFSCVRSQENVEYRLIGGPCEGCEAVMEYEGKVLNAVDTLPEFNASAEKLKITGTIFKPDGITPAENVILYIHHTNAKGVYPTRGDEKGWAKRHGYLRGWVKTGKDGEFTFFTQVPSGYPDRKTPAHIHPYILEPDGRYYYLSAYFFNNDSRFNQDHMEDPPRGSNGLVKVKEEDGYALIERDFVLGKNIPGYQ